MKTLRNAAAALLLALTAVACTGAPTGPTLDAAPGTAQLDGIGMFGGGTREP